MVKNSLLYRYSSKGQTRQQPQFSTVLFSDLLRPIFHLARRSLGNFRCLSSSPCSGLYRGMENGFQVVFNLVLEAAAALSAIARAVRSSNFALLAREEREGNYRSVKGPNGYSVSKRSHHFPGGDERRSRSKPTRFGTSSLFSFAQGVNILGRRERDMQSIDEPFI